MREVNPDSTRKPRSPRRRSREAVQAEIIDAAERCMADSGLGTPMERVAARARVAVGTLYNYFENREALVTAVLARRHAELDAHLTAQALAHRPFPDSLATLVHATFAHFRRHAAIFGVVMQQERVHRRPGHGPGMLIVLAHARVAVAGARAGAASRGRPTLSAELCVGCLRAGLLWLLSSKRSAATWAAVEAEVIAFALAGLGHAPR
jgi:AcrR family transcriptional regulator